MNPAAFAARYMTRLRGMENISIPRLFGEATGMLFKNALVFTEEKGFVRGGFTVAEGRFARVFAGETAEKGTDLGGRRVIPGLVDIHIHGAAGADMADADPDGLRRMGRYLARRGVTSFVPTAAALPKERLAAAMACASALSGREGPGCAGIVGVRMEGPYLSPEKKGAQNGAFLRLPDRSEAERRAAARRRHGPGAAGGGRACPGGRRKTCRGSGSYPGGL